MRAFALAMLVTTATLHAASARQPQSAARVIEITAERFEFWPPEITMTDDEVVELRLRSDDTAHGFRLVGTSTSLVIPKRGKGVATARLTGLTPGKYTFECNRMCGAGHHFMRGVLKVIPATGVTP
jgi:heme/copper-type cytochrome/quinol oxidase subunit 2